MKIYVNWTKKILDFIEKNKEENQLTKIETKFCKDCKFVNKETLKFDVDLVQCTRFTQTNSSYICPVTGKEIAGSRDHYYCKYERALGFCQDGKFFEPEQKERPCEESV